MLYTTIKSLSALLKQMIYQGGIMSKKLLLSLCMSTLALSLFVNNDASAYPRPQGPDMDFPAPCCNSPAQNALHARMGDPKFMEMLQPVREANRALFIALELGNIKNIQSNAKQFATAMKNVSDPEIKKLLINAIHLAELMSVGKPTYRELLSTYLLIKQETAGFHHHRRQFRERFPRLMVDTMTYNTLITAEEQMQILINSLVSDSESALNSKIDNLMNTLKNIKISQLQSYVVPLLTTLSDMKKAKTVLSKITYKQLVIGRTTQLLMITKEKN